jgi:hypothetical protein
MGPNILNIASVWSLIWKNQKYKNKQYNNSEYFMKL